MQASLPDNITIVIVGSVVLGVDPRLGLLNSAWYPAVMVLCLRSPLGVSVIVRCHSSPSSRTPNLEPPVLLPI